LAKFFTELKGALVAFLYLIDKNEDCVGEKGQMSQTLRGSKSLSKATENIENLENIRFPCRITVLGTLYYATIVLPLLQTIADTAQKANTVYRNRSRQQLRNNTEMNATRLDPARATIIETSQFLHLICHGSGTNSNTSSNTSSNDTTATSSNNSNNDTGPLLNLNEVAPRWLELVKVSAETPTGPIQKIKHLALVRFPQFMEVLKTTEMSTIIENIKVRTISTLQNFSTTQKLYMSLFASFSCFGYFYVYSCGWMGKEESTRKKNVLPSVPASITKILSNNAKRIIENAVSVVSEEIKGGGVV